MDFTFFGDLLEEEAPAAQEAPGEGCRNVWVFAETAQGTLLPATAEVMAKAREMADQIGCYVHAILVGDGIGSLAETLVQLGADRVLIADDAELAAYQPEQYVELVASLVRDYSPEILLLPDSPLGGDLAPRLAQRLDTGLLSHCVRVEIDMSERLLVGTFPVLGGEMYHVACCPQARPQMATLRAGAFRRAQPDRYRSGEIRNVDAGSIPPATAGSLTWLDTEAEVTLPPVPLRRARIVVAAGRGLVDSEGFARVEELAQKLGGIVAGSRGALDEGWIGEDQLIGVGGEAVAPDLYLACGLSGDVFHTYGVQNAKFVVAINCDDRAPITKIANLVAVGDAKQIVRALIEAL